MDKYVFCAPCLIGAESVASGEFERLGFEDVRCEDGRVYFTGGMAELARANILSRYTERVLLRLASFPAADFDSLFDGVRAVAWEDFIAPGAAFPVKGYSLRSKLESVPACQRIIKKAAAARLMSVRGTDWLEEREPGVRIQFSIVRDRADIFIDTSGDPLYKRGWRADGGGAPIRETLAAVMVDLSRFRGDMRLRDPFCGSGTIAIEAALKARRIAPGINRRFAAENYPFVPAALWRGAREEAREAQRGSDAVIEAYDIDPAAVARARANAQRAGVGDAIRFAVRDAAREDYRETDVVVTNPPYGERMGDTAQARELYRAFGKAFGAPGERGVYLISPDAEFEREFGYRAARKRWLYNGMIKCSLYMYFPARRPRAAQGGNT